ncbi:hypothetical Protein YC6258_00895 [Gynuella sunshinyii YC6258]|uniref:Uncharacterized protein n=1 Tax=Gynuella sunshinyii YC6258 TaxID=1445510 RepID=A0A0C5V047_9GAMM|nr:hypothetical Protein YC6258_00895 [Gynuella sunshinyii YC6258]
MWSQTGENNLAKHYAAEEANTRLRGVSLMVDLLSSGL